VTEPCAKRDRVAGAGEDLSVEGSH
ncbi:hypothetical protein A2U01_0067998, partial [Trifolium medium]|nr:hypothetical protein [Trifolium medium]